MRAARFYSPGDIRVEDIAEPVAGPGEVKVRVAYNGICGTDLHEYFEDARLVPVAAPHPRSGVRAPVVIGHEAAGHVAELGDGVGNVAVGDLVAIDPHLHCGTCASCRGGAGNLCRRGLTHGLNTGGGGLAEFTVVPAANVHRVPAGVSAREAAIAEPMAVSYHAVSRAAPRAGQTVVVHGAGPIGIGAFLALRRLALDPIVVEPAPLRRAAVERLGARHVVDPAGVDAVEAIMDVTGGRGADIEIDAVGLNATFATALATIVPHGTIVVVGASATSVELPLLALFGKEIHLTGSRTYMNEFPAVIEAIAAGGYPLDGWVTTVPLADVLTGGYEPLRRGEEIKVLVEVAGDAAVA